MTIYINIEDFTRWNKLVTEGKKNKTKNKKLWDVTHVRYLK